MKMKKFVELKYVSHTNMYYNASLNEGSNANNVMFYITIQFGIYCIFCEFNMHLIYVL